MNLKTLLAAGISLAITAPVMASNGKPFQELQNQIDDNRELINSNANAIQGLRTDVSAIQDHLVETDSRLDSLEVNVANNTQAINDTLVRLNTAENNINDLHAQLGDLTAQHAADMQAISNELATINQRILELNQLREDLANDLNAQLADLNQKVTDNAVAIDSIVLQLLTVNAQLSGVNSDILNLQTRQDNLEDSFQIASDQLAELQGKVDDLSVAVSTLQSYHLYTFSGIQTDIPAESLNGWSECYTQTYGVDAPTSDMLSACTGNKIMLACRPTGGETFTVAAYANREEVFRDTGENNNIVHNANGVDWYFSPNYSMGFAPEGEGVLRNSADVQDTQSPLRLSWHTHSHFAKGFRCGNSAWINNDNNWEKVILQAD